jgi:hypothetical protein
MNSFFDGIEGKSVSSFLHLQKIIIDPNYKGGNGVIKFDKKLKMVNLQRYVASTGFFCGEVTAS